MHLSRTTSALVVAAGLLFAGCVEGGRTEYRDDGDSGAAAPGTQQVPNTAAAIGVDSTLGVGQRTGRGGVAGTRGDTTPRPPDSTGQRPPQ